MIRTFFAYFNAVLTTVSLATLVFALSLLRVRGPIYATLTRIWAHGLLWGAASDVRAHGMDRVDWAKPHVLVCNHTGSFEILAIATTVPTAYHFVAKKELERIPVFGPAWKRAGHISIDRSNRQRALESLRTAAEILRRDGGIVIIFPEGTRSLSGDLQPFKRGAFQLAIEAGVPVIPVVVTGSDRITPPGGTKIRPGVMDLYVGDPIESTRFLVENADDLGRAVHGRMKEMLETARHLVPA
jgi:1-acyl-sn-glycerol-3-phosphate acyltransferase